MFTRVNKGENPAHTSIDDDVVKAICSRREFHVQARQGLNQQIGNNLVAVFFVV
jgi:hypothetical protein